MQQNRRPILIDIEGTDGSGKATQTKLLFDYLSGLGYKCKLLSFPNYESQSSAPVKMYLNGELGQNNKCLNCYQASSLYAVDRLITMKQFTLTDYDFVLFDRYTPSNMIHHSTNISDNEVSPFLEWVADFEYVKLGLPEPDITIFLDVPSEVSIALAAQRATLKNGQKTDILEKDTAYLHLAYSRAKYVAEKLDWNTINCVKNNTILSEAEIHNKIKQTLLKRKYL